MLRLKADLFISGCLLLVNTTYLCATVCSNWECNSTQFCARTSPKVRTFWHSLLFRGSCAKISFSELGWHQVVRESAQLHLVFWQLCWYEFVWVFVCVCVCLQMLLEVVAKTLKHHGISAEHECFEACSKRLFDISKFYLKVSFAHTQTVFLLYLYASVQPGHVLWPYAVFSKKSVPTN